MYYIHAASTISHNNTFSNKGFSENISSLNEGSVVIQPNYKEYIEPGILRRMSQIIRMSTCCAIDCIKQSAIDEPEAIIVGTGLGCLNDTEKFLMDFVSHEEHLISPTPFIQSTHNTIAGQLSLVLKNHSYNMTHTQNTLSFEYALQDGLLCIDEGKEFILVGATDEHVNTLNELAYKLNFKNVVLTSGASFFVLSKKKRKNNNVKITASTACGMISSSKEVIESFFLENHIQLNTIDLILYSCVNNHNENNFDNLFKDNLLCNYSKYCGIYFTNSAFGLHLGIDILNRKKVKFDFMEEELTNVKSVLVCNNLSSKNIGLTLLESDEA